MPVSTSREISAEHLPASLDEFTFWSNRRHVRVKGMFFFRPLGGTVTAGSATLQELVKVLHLHSVSWLAPTMRAGEKSLPGQPLLAYGAVRAKRANAWIRIACLFHSFGFVFELRDYQIWQLRMLL
ncbi:MAG: hypothetical protein ACYDHP_09205 [Ferrimicrobium sp.]